MRGKIGAKRYLTRRPHKSGGLGRHRLALYGVGRVVNKLNLERKYANGPRKTGARHTPSAKLLIPWGELRSINSVVGVRRDSLSRG